MRAYFGSLVSVVSIFSLGACAPSNRAPQAAAPIATSATSAPSVTAAVAPVPVAAAPATPATRASAAPELPATVAELQRAALASKGATDVVASLTTEVGARLAGSAGDRAAIAWAKRTLASHGLTDVRAEDVTVPHWERGAETAAILAPYTHSLSVTALGWSVATPAGGLRADVIEVDSLDAMMKLDDKAVAGKILFVNQPMRRSKDGRGYGEAVGVRARGAIEAAKKGAAAFLIRSIGTDHERLPHTGAMRRDKSGHAIPAAALSVPDAEQLHRVIEAAKAAKKEPVRVALNIGAKALPDATSANVIGEVRGREKAEEIVLLGAHLDSWDLATGAIDDGAGCGIVIEAGRLLAALPQKPKRTVRVVLFAAEENSLSGAGAYAKAHAAEVAHHVAALEADAGTDRVLFFRYLGAPEARARFTAIAPRLTPLGIAMSEEDGTGGADTSPLRELGVPVIDLEQDFTRYFDLHHTANDTFDKVDPDALAQAAAAFATAAWSIAEMDGDFGRIPEAKRAPKW